MTADGAADEVEMLQTRTVTVLDEETNAVQVKPVPGSAEGDATAAMEEVAFVMVTVPLVQVPAPSELPPMEPVVPESWVVCAYCEVRFATGVLLTTWNGGVPLETIE